MATIASVCVYCGSSSNVRQDYKDAATRLGATMAAEGVRLVYGGGQVGLMGLVADAVLAGGGAVTGVIPEFLHEAEVGKQDLTELLRVGSMHERKMIMAERSDAFVVLPGGFGSLDELFEILTWRQLGLHDKPIVVVNTEGYWTRLIEAIDHIVDEGFARPENRDLFSVVDTVEAVLPSLRAAGGASFDVKAKWI
ncbi:MAG: TIGR00730 family Rossman fold protein [Alphaproteobacteria bacterium]|nr:TIGR00730 family Rossman fold protein [Alphaproteobacteria bacterium]